MVGSTRTIVVCGATGRQGGAVVRALLRRGRFHVVCLVRNPATEKALKLKEMGAQIIHGNMSSPESLEVAFAGAYGVFSMQTPWSPSLDCETGREVIEGRNVARAAKLASVKHLVYASALGAGTGTASRVPFLESKGVIESEIAAAGVPYTFLRSAGFMENWVAGGAWARMAIKPGSVPGITGPDTPVQYVSVEDVGECAAVAFEQPEAYLGRAIDLAGDVKTGREVCALLEKLVGYSFEYAETPAWLLRLIAPDTAAMAEWLERRPCAVDIEALRQRLPGLRTVAAYFDEAGFAKRLAERPSPCCTLM